MNVNIDDDFKTRTEKIRKTRFIGIVSGWAPFLLLTLAGCILKFLPNFEFLALLLVVAFCFVSIFSVFYGTYYLIKTKCPRCENAFFYSFFKFYHNSSTSKCINCGYSIKKNDKELEG